MGKRGKKPAVSHEERLKELKNHDIFDVDGKLKKKSDPVWVNICNQINVNKDAQHHLKPPNLYEYVAQNRNNVLNDLKEKQSDNDIKSETSNDNIITAVYSNNNQSKNLISIANNAFYKPIIKEINTYPFTIFHWSTNAIDIASSLVNDNVFIFKNFGCFCKDFVTCDGSKSKQINSYIFGVELSDTFIPICDLLTEDSSTSLFERFLNDILRDGMNVPSKLIIDYNFNLIRSVLSSLNNNIDFQNYLETCFLVLTNDQQMPNCIFVTDIELLISKVINCKLIQEITHDSIKILYIQCIVILSFQDNITNFKSVLGKIFELCTGKYRNQCTHNAFNFLMSAIKNRKIDQDYNKERILSLQVNSENTLEFKIDFNFNYNKCFNIITYLENIIIESMQNSSEENITNERNAYYNIDFCTLLCQVCIEFPIWTEVMLKKQNSEGRSILQVVQHYKQELSHHLCDESGFLSNVDEVILKNIDFNYNRIETARNKTSLESVQLIKKLKVDASFMNYEENWMGLNKQLSECSSSTESIDSQSKINYQSFDTSTNSNKLSLELNKPMENAERGVYLRPCPELDILLQNPLTKPKNRKIIKNSSFLKIKKVKGKKFNLTSSSCFDCIIEILTTAYYIIKNFYTSINNFTNILNELHQNFIYILKSYVQSLNLPELYTARLTFLSKVCENNNCTITWSRSIGEFIEQILYANIYKQNFCSTCNDYTYNHLQCVRLSLDDIITKGVTVSLHEVVSKSIELCHTCKSRTNLFKLEIKDFICIDVENENTNENHELKLNNLETVITCNQNKFLLIGIVNLQEPIGSNAMRHYVAYCRTLEGSWFVYDDTTENPVKVNDNAIIQPAIFFYFKYTDENSDYDIEKQKSNSKLMKISGDNGCVTNYKLTLEKRNVIEDRVIHSDESKDLIDSNRNEDAIYTDENKDVIDYDNDVDSNNIKFPETRENNLSRENSFTKTHWATDSQSSDESDFFQSHFLAEWRNLIQNGLKLPAIHIENNTVYLKNTCPIDTVFEIFVAAYSFKASFRELSFVCIVHQKNKIFEILSNYIDIKSRVVYYKGRAEFCLTRTDLFTQTTDKVNNMIQIDCRQNVIKMFEEMIGNNYSVTKKITCSNCNYQNFKTYKVQLINTNYLKHDDDLKNLQNYFNSVYADQQTSCYKCKKQAQKKYSIKNYLCIETETNYMLHKTLQSPLNIIPMELTVCKEKLALIGVVEFIPPITDESMMHYVSYIKLSNGQWEERDDLKEQIIVYKKHSQKRIKPALLFYAQVRVHNSEFNSMF